MREESSPSNLINLIELNEEISEQLEPKKARAERNRISADNCDEKAWKAMQDAVDEYQIDLKRENQEMLQNAKHKLESAYVQVEEEEPNWFMAESEKANKRCMCKESW